MSFSIDFVPQNLMATMSTVIGMLGGLLGFYTFIDNYVLRFKPKFIFGDRIYLVYEQSEKHKDYSYLSSLILQVEVFNHRNKLGRIEDLFFKIYDSREQEPTVVNLYAKSVLENMPKDREGIFSADRSPSSTIAINNKSSKSVVLELGQEKNHNSTISPSGHLYVEAFYKLTKGKWRKMDGFFMHAAFDEMSNHEKYAIYNFELSDKWGEREELKQREIKRVVTSYKGVSDIYFRSWISRFYSRVKSVGIGFANLMKFAIHAVIAFGRVLLSESIVWSVVKRKGGIPRKINVTVGNARNSKKTDQFIKSLKEIIKRKIVDVNLFAPESEKIVFEERANEITLIKNGQRLKIYKGGDGYVYAFRPNKVGGMGKTIFSITIRNYPFGMNLWVSDGRAVFPSTIATKLIDFVSFHVH